MARTPTKDQKARLTLDLLQPVRDRLEDLRRQTQADTLTEVIRRALAVYDFLWTEKAKGSRLVVKDPKGQERDVVLL
jgi:hypothetical protein